MPVTEIAPGRFRWGRSGKTYGTRAAAQRQARAAYASGYREDATAKLARRVLGASRKAETAYKMALVRIMGRVHDAVMHVVRTEHLAAPAAAEERADAPPGPRVGLGPDLLRRIMRFVQPQAQLAFDFMARDVDKKSADGHHLLGVKARMVPGLARVIDKARKENVDLITNASEDFLEQVRDTLEEFGSLHPGRGASSPRGPDEEGEERGPRDLAEALQQRVAVSRSRAVLVARDQTTKLAGALNAHRQQSAGIQRFKWVTSHDERVRASHRQLDGKTFSWDDDAREEEMADYDIVEEDDDPAPIPGSGIQCRCTASPVIEELEEEPGGGEAEEPDEEV
jgi:SPP1 gp7 family putative phage head morphogenesis protein